MRRAPSVVLIAALTGAFTGAIPPLAWGEGERTRELDAVRRAIAERRERVAAFERHERGLLETLEGMDRAAARLTAELAHARRRAHSARTQLDALTRRAAELAERRQRTGRAMSARAVALYKGGEAGPVEALFSARSLQELLERSRALRILLEHDRQLLDRFQADGATLERTRAELSAAALEHERAARLAREHARELERERRSRRELLVAVRSDRAHERTALVELEAAAVALEETLASLQGAAAEESGGSGGASFASLQGSLDSPVDAPVARAFGRVIDAEFRTETYRKGIDFAAEAGTPVRAVAAGVALFAGWFRGYGRLVILDHGEQYFSVSGHLGEIRVAVGDAVSAGDTIGTVGETGSLSGPRLYFEIRRGTEPLDPQRWLRRLVGLD